MILVDQLQAISDGFQALAKANGGGVQLCADPNDVFERMKQNPNGLWIYADWTGDSPWNENSDETHVKRRAFVVTLYRSRLSAVDPAAGVAKAIGALEASLNLMQLAVEAVNELRFVQAAGSDNDGDPFNVPQNVTSGPHFTYTGMQKNYYEDSFEITFSIATMT